MGSDDAGTSIAAIKRGFGKGAQRKKTLSSERVDDSDDELDEADEDEAEETAESSEEEESDHEKPKPKASTAVSLLWHVHSRCVILLRSEGARPVAWLPTTKTSPPLKVRSHGNVCLFD